jgi:glycosyltransferase involved in cell wall biosynthesis
MNLLMLGVGAAGLDDPRSEPVQRHLEYARRLGGNIDLIVDSPRLMQVEHGPGLRVWTTGTGRASYVSRAVALALRASGDHPPDVITTQDPFLTAYVGLSLRRQIRRPVIIQNHSSFLGEPHWVRERPVVYHALRELARALLPRADGWRVVNAREREYYVERLRLPPDRVRVLPVPCRIEPFLIDPAPTDVERRRAELGLRETDKVLLWVGRPVRVKRLPILFSVFERVRTEHPGARLVLVGDPSLVPDEERHAPLPQGAVWAGQVAFDGLPAFYALADVFAFTSSYEGFGRVLVEAGAAARPAVATATAGARDIIRHGETGFLEPIDDSWALATHVRALLAAPAQAQALGRAARQHVRAAFDPERAFNAIVSHWREVAGCRV